MKGVVSAEELKLQMGEVLPNAIQIMAIAAKDAGLTVDGTVKSMMDLQQKGGLISDKVLPHFAKRMSEAARANGGLDKALLSNRVSMNRLLFSFQEAADVIFKSGFSTGLTELFNTMANSMVDLKPLWQSLGSIMGSIFKVVSNIIKYITPMFISLSNVLKSITDSLGDGASFLVAMVGPIGWMYKIFGSSIFTKLPIVGQFVLLLDLIKEVAFWAEELDNLLFSKNKIGVLYDPRSGVKGNALIDYLTPFTSPEKIAKQQTMLNGDPTQGLKSLPQWILNQRAMGGSYIPDINVNKQPAVNVVIGADAEKLGITAASSGAVKDMVDSKLREIQN